MANRLKKQMVELEGLTMSLPKSAMGIQAGVGVRLLATGVELRASRGMRGITETPAGVRLL